MDTFTVYGFEYPRDGQHAELMAQYLAPPSVASDKWALIRDWADSRQVSADDMLCFLQAIDTGAANVILGGQFRTDQDLDQIASKLGIDITTEEELRTYTAPTGPHTLSGSMMDDKATINGETYTNYDGTFSEAQPAIQRYLDTLGWGEVASEQDITWGLSEEEWLVRDSKGVVCVIDTHNEIINY